MVEVLELRLRFRSSSGPRIKEAVPPAFEGSPAVGRTLALGLAGAGFKW